MTLAVLMTSLIVLPVGTQISEPLPPGRITDLSAAPVGATSVQLTWTDVALDANHPEEWYLGVFEFYSSTAGPITTGNWNSDQFPITRVYVHDDLPAPPGTRRSEKVVGLASGIPHWFAIRLLNMADENIFTISEPAAATPGVTRSEPWRWSGLTMEGGLYSSCPVVVDDHLYRLAQNGSFNRHAITEWNEGTWESLAPGTAGVDLLVPAGNGLILAFHRMHMSERIYRYAIRAVDGQAAGTWKEFMTTGPSGPVAADLYGAFDGLDHIYFPSRNSRLSIADMIWVAIVPPPVAFDHGGAVVGGSDGRLYAFSGGGTTRFWVSSTSEDERWTELEECPAPDVDRWTLCRPGRGSFLYALTAPDGDLWQYSIEDDAWSMVDMNQGCLEIAGGHPRYLFTFGGDNGQTAWRYDFNQPARQPTPPVQLRSGGYSEIAAGAVIREAGFVATAFMNDPEGDDVAFQVQVKPAGVTFLDTDRIVTGTLEPSGSRGSVIIEGLERGVAYHWRARARDAYGLESPWVSYGVDDIGVDLEIRTNSGPALLSSDQLRPDGGPIGVGERLLGTRRIVLQASAIDAEADPIAAIEIEIRNIGEPFRGIPTATGDGEVAMDLEDGAYHWQVRAVDDLPGGEGEWKSFGGNPEDEADVVIYASYGGSTGSGNVCGQSACGVPAPWAIIALAAVYSSCVRRLIRQRRFR